VIVVSNTSPIMNLATVGQLNLLNWIYGKIIIPESVLHELSIIDLEQPIQSLSWIEKQSVIDKSLIDALSLDLDLGEAEAIALAREMEADLLLIDERRGRKVASRLGLKFIGLLGVLLEAKHKGFVMRVKPILDELIAKAGFWVSGQLYNRVLYEIGEL